MAKGYLVLFAFLWFCINRFMRTRGQTLQAAYRSQIQPFEPYLQFAVTLTLKQNAKIATPYPTGLGSYKRWERLDDEKTASTIRYFTALLRKQLFGNHCKHRNKAAWATPLALYTVEGRRTNKRRHIHAAIGNVPAAKVEHFSDIVDSAWQQCDFADRQTCIKPISSAAGWLHYITKEIGYTDDDCLAITSASIPPFIQQSICT